MKKKAIMVIVGHLDDEVFGCGGLIARCSSEDYQVHIMILGEGATSRTSTREQALKKAKVLKALHGLEDSANQAAEILGAASVRFGGFPDNRFDSVALLDVIKQVEKAKNQINPSWLITHHPHDLNIDHRLTFQAVITAARPLPGETVKKIWCFETLSSTEYAVARPENSFAPNCFVDITGDPLKKTHEAILKYSSEMRPFPHPRSEEAVTAMAMLRGSQCGVNAAEAFWIARHIE